MAELFYPDGMGDEVVALRPWAERDVSCIEQAAEDPRISEGTSVPARYTPEEGLAFIRRQQDRLACGEGISLAVTRQATDEAVGLVWLPRRPQEGVAGIGYWIVPRARRQSLGNRAVALATAWGLTVGGFARVEAWVEPDNTPSQRVLEANGYSREGLLRSFLGTGSLRRDVLVYSRLRCEMG